MPLWQIALIALVGAWALQAVGTYFQMRHYRGVMGDVSRRWADGFVGAGSAKSTFGKGGILLMVVSQDGIVRRLSVMQGRSVFAKFKHSAEFDGMPLAQLRTLTPFADPGRTKALGIAIAQIDRAAQRAQPKPATIAATRRADASEGAPVPVGG